MFQQLADAVKPGEPGPPEGPRYRPEPARRRSRREGVRARSSSCRGRHPTYTRRGRPRAGRIPSGAGRFGGQAGTPPRPYAHITACPAHERPEPSPPHSGARTCSGRWPRSASASSRCTSAARPVRPESGTTWRPARLSRASGGPPESGRSGCEGPGSRAVTRNGSAATTRRGGGSSRSHWAGCYGPKVR